MGHIARFCPNRKSCFQCGALDHMRPDCPQLKKGAIESFGGGKNDRGGETKIEPTRVKGRAFHMTTDEAMRAPDVVTGTFLITSTLAKVLFDSGANRSFASPNFIRELGVKPKRLTYSFVVDVADDRSVTISEVYEGCSIFIDSHGFPVCLYPMGMGEFDVILGWIGWRVITPKLYVIKS